LPGLGEGDHSALARFSLGVDKVSFGDMAAELRGWVPKAALPLSETLVNRALQKVYDESGWSFQNGIGGFTTANEVTGGTITTTLGGSTVVGDLIASAAWAAIPAPFQITTFQIRLPDYNLYSVISATPNTPSAGLTTLTLDRPWVEPAGVGQTYQLYQAYYPAPVADFKRWLTVRDFTNAIYLDFWSWKQDDLAVIDPQRTVFQNPDHLVPFTRDSRPGSATLGFMLFELYPNPLIALPYATFYLRSGPLLQNPSDTVPFPLTDELILHRAKGLCYEWAEANKGRYPELMKSDWRFLMKAADLEFKERLKDIRKLDRDLCDNFVRILKRANPSIGAPYFSAITNQGSVGIFG
jgi:hypothetical protein